MSVNLSSNNNRYGQRQNGRQHNNHRQLMKRSLDNAQAIKDAIKTGDKKLMEQTLSQFDNEVSINTDIFMRSGINIKTNERHRQNQTVISNRSNAPKEQESVFQRQIHKRVQSATHFQNRHKEMHKKLRLINKEMKKDPLPRYEISLQHNRQKPSSIFTEDLLSSKRQQASVHDSKVRRLVNTNIDEYFETSKNKHKCINCAKCLSPQGGKLIQYKYPQAVGTTNHKIHSQFIQQNSNLKIQNPVLSTDRLSFNYDSIRNNIRAENKRQFMTPKVQNNSKTNKIGFRAREIIQEMPARMKTNCFLGTTSYKIQFDKADTIFKPTSTKPNNYPPVEYKFRANSSYQQNFESNHHKEQASGSALANETREMKLRQKQLVNHNRKGFMNSGNNPFEGHSSSAKAQTAVVNSPMKMIQGTAKDYKLQDSLLCSNQIRTVTHKSTKQYYYDAKKLKYCNYQTDLKLKQ